MKKRTKFLVANFKMLHLYRDDLEKIEHILKEELGAEDFNISTSDFEFKSVTDIQPDTLPANYLTIKTYRPYCVSIELQENSANLYFAENSLVEQGAFSELASLLNNRQRTLLHNVIRPWVGPLCIWVAVGAVFVLPKSYIRNLWFAWIAFFAIGMLWILLSYIITTRRYTIVDFVNKSAKPNFIIRNKDQIIVNSIFMLFGALLGVFLTKLFL